ncbi:MAG TPA: Clp protease N-terminal domain-containing protein, partial [Candidatus Mcinerneyibacteriales bacterium]|nr:Clp protease N-terminal domain-containing protein [Candidatus Mcinerneyibacteriales bacterium]
MYDRFSERARKVVLYAREEAARLNYDFIGTEHLLLGLLREGASIGVIVLRRLEVDINLLRDEIKKFIIQDGDRARVDHDIQLTPRAKRVLELAMDEAGRMGHNFVGTEHILLGLLREGEGIASRVLKNFGVTPDRVRTEVVRLLSGDLEGDIASARGKTGQKSSPLDDFSRDLTRLAIEDKLDPVIGREHEIERVIQILARRKKNNPVL